MIDSHILRRAVTRMFRPLALTGLMSIGAGLAWSAEPASSGSLVYEAAFFKDANPATALDMVSRVPGFRIEDGEDIRGFSGAVGNVLINGSRPASKVESPSTTLARIPASRVVRIELIRGGGPGIDMQGRAAVVNVVLSSETETNQALQADLQALEQGPFLWGGQYERRSSNLDQEWSIQFGRGIYAIDSTGSGRLVRFGRDGAEQVRETVDNTFDAHTWTAAASWERRFGDSRIDVTGSGSLTDYNDSIAYVGSTDARRFGFSMDLVDLDAAVVFQRTLSPSLDFELRLLQSYGEDELQSDGVTGAGTQAFSTRRKTSETIARASLLQRRSRSLSLEAGAEVTFNWLDARQRFAVDGAEVALPQATTQVDELRGELFASSQWQTSKTLLLEAGLRLEQSVISQNGDGSARRSFFYPKPRLTATWDAGPDQQFRLRLEREIGQLNFLDFAASSNLANDQVLGGNIDLRPIQRWIAEVSYEYRFASEGVFNLKFRHDALDDVVDLIPLDGGLSATGNLGSGTLDRISVDARLPLKRLGLERGRLVASWRYDWLRVTDPVSGRQRGISFEARRTASFRFENEVPAYRLSWGVDYMPYSSSPTYDPDQTRFFRIRDQFAVFAERRFLNDLSVRIEINIWDDLEIPRSVYADRTPARPVLFTEQQSIDPRNRFQIRVRQAF